MSILTPVMVVLVVMAVGGGSGCWCAYSTTNTPAFAQIDK